MNLHKPRFPGALAGPGLPALVILLPVRAIDLPGKAPPGSTRENSLID